MSLRSLNQSHHITLRNSHSPFKVLRPRWSETLTNRKYKIFKRGSRWTAGGRVRNVVGIGWIVNIIGAEDHDQDQDRVLAHLTLEILNEWRTRKILIYLSKRSPYNNKWSQINLRLIKTISHSWKSMIALLHPNFGRQRGPKMILRIIQHILRQTLVYYSSLELPILSWKRSALTEPARTPT